MYNEKTTLQSLVKKHVQHTKDPGESQVKVA